MKGGVESLFESFILSGILYFPCKPSAGTKQQPEVFQTFAKRVGGFVFQTFALSAKVNHRIWCYKRLSNAF